jgi:deoxyribonuclease-4
MRFGFHLSIAGGFSKIPERAAVRGCETVQFFSRNPRGWIYGALNKEDVKAFRSAVRAPGLPGLFPLFVHLPYLPNVACSRSKFYRRSIRSVITDLKRAEALGAQYLILHIGHRLESSEEEAVEAVCHAINEAFRSAANSVIVLLENTAGQGSEIGSSFEEIGRILDGIGKSERIGVCLDTAHAFGAGFDLSTRDGLERTLESFERLIGVRRLHLLHLNDSKTPLGSRRDRHAHIGEGFIGLEGFRNIVNHPLLRDLPGIMETPRTDTVEDLKNMKVIRSLVEMSA